MQTDFKKRRGPAWTTHSASDPLIRDFEKAPETLHSSLPSSSVWDLVLTVPGVRTWRVLRDIAFLLTSFPIGLAAFIVAIVGGVLGLSLSWLLIGIPILIWTVGFTLRFAMHERGRLNSLLSLDLEEPRYPANNGENAIKHLWQVVRSPHVRNDVMYMALLFPIGIIELALVLAPLEFFVPSLMHLVFGNIASFDVFGISLNSRPEAMLFMGLGVILLFPLLVVMNFATNLHGALARKLLQSQRP